MPSGKEAAPGPLARAVSEEVRAILARQRFTGAALAESTGMSRNYVGKRLRDEASFTLDDIERISEVLGVPYADIIAAAAQSAATTNNGRETGENGDPEPAPQTA